jgi:hypothetical protein
MSSYTYSRRLANGLCALALALMLAFGAVFMTTEPADGASCWGRVANASYGNTSGYVYVRADTGCSTNASLYITAMVSRNGYQVSSNSNSGWGTWLDTSTSGYWCGSVAVGYSHNSGGGAGYGWTTDLWSC